MNEILLIRVLYPGGSPTYEPLIPAGLGYLAESLKQEGFNYEVLDMSLGYNFNDIKRKILDVKPDLIGLSLLTYRYKSAYQLIRQIKKINREIKIVVGGSHVSTFREDVLNECQDIDFGIVLEGERTIIELCQEKEIKKIKGLIHRENDNIIYNGDREFIEDLDSISFPTYDRFELNRYLFSKDVPLPIVSSRGCPYQCIYCPVVAAIGKKFRTRSASNVVDEIEHWYKRGYFHFTFLDDNFTLDKTRVYEICDEIQRRNLHKLKLMAANGVRADKIDKNLLRRMKEIGFYLISFGIEAGNDKVLRSLKKGEDIELIDMAIRDACDLGYEVELFFLVGSPSETWRDLEDSFALALRYPVIDAKFFNLVPYPKTELFTWVKENDYFVSQPEDYLNSESAWGDDPVFVSPELPLRQRRKALKYSKCIRKKIRKKYYERLLANYGIAGKFFSSIIVTNFVQNKLMFNVSVRKILRKIKKLLLK